ncbi:MAG: family 20 glycosylhydrolase [Chloroflexi bacterium]|nr:family 20 glycosylhydrolase [Chloroflexota bacterium]
MTSSDLFLVPMPQQLDVRAGIYKLPENGLIVLDGPEAAALRFVGERLQAALRAHAGRDWRLVAGPPTLYSALSPLAATQAEPGGRIVLHVVPQSTRHPQGYELTVTARDIHVVASTPAGAFYAVATLAQILEQTGPTLPQVRIRDWPDFPNRGVMLDISRDKVPTMSTLYDLVDMLAGLKINQFQLYTEHTFAYQQHPVVWAQASPMTGEEILALDAYTHERFMDLVPNQNTFGHMRRWLTHDEYRDLAECPEGCDTVWGHFDEPFSLNPLDPRSLELVRSMLDELLPHFRSPFVNVGGDETVDLGRGRSREAVEAHGEGPVYMDYLLKIYREVRARGRRMMFWGDIIVQYPDLVPRLPRDMIALEWGYEADHPFAKHAALFASSGLPFYVCPGTSTWNTIAGRTDNALANLRNAAENGLRHGAVGYLNTDWGDNGHWQPLPMSYLGYVYGAALSWAYHANRDLDIVRALDTFVFRDRARVMGRIVYDLGNAYQVPGVLVHNASILFRILQWPPERIAQIEGLTEDGLRATLAYIDRAVADLDRARMDRADAELLRREVAWAADMLRHAARRGLWALGRARGQEDRAHRERLAQEAEALMATFRELWHARNRPGGFADSLARMQRMASDYRA